MLKVNSQHLVLQKIIAAICKAAFIKQIRAVHGMVVVAVGLHTILACKQIGVTLYMVQVIPYNRQHCS